MSSTPPSSSKEEAAPTKPSVRHAEKRRLSSCRFADRVAQASIDCYKAVVPNASGIACLSTLVAHNCATNQLTVVALGVGTKFLAQETLLREDHGAHYGRRVRDSHAEVLCRRAFRRYLTNEIHQDLLSPKQPANDTENAPEFRLLERCCSDERNDNVENNNIRQQQRPSWKLKPHMTLHAYCSSAPCGNATLKKFADLRRHKIVCHDELSDNEWPVDHPHPAQSGHSVALGQFALLVKHDRTCPAVPLTPIPGLSAKQSQWPVVQSTDWCPPGTTTVWASQGTLHTCSDKLGRWNCLGWQGSLLSALIKEPLHISTLIVGRKLSLATCRRAVCCRIHTASDINNPYQCRHPTILSNAVYLEEHAAVETHRDTFGEDVRFHSSVCYSWWHGKTSTAEAIDGSTGFLAHVSDNDAGDDDTEDDNGDDNCISAISTHSLAVSFLELCRDNDDHVIPTTLAELRALKRHVSPDYEQAKERLLTQHPVMKHWKRRQQVIDVGE